MWALRILAIMSAIGSLVGILFSLPAGFADSGNFALQAHIPEADAADSEFTQKAARTSAQRAPIVFPDPKLLLFGRLGH
jgi:hypothetical protein